MAPANRRFRAGSDIAPRSHRSAQVARSILARVKFLSRLLTALNLLPSIATLACVSKPSSRHSDELRANLADRSSVVLAEIRNRLVVGDEPAEQPHDLN